MRVLIAAIALAVVGLTASYHHAKPAPWPVAGDKVWLPMPPPRPAHLLKDEGRLPKGTPMVAASGRFQFVPSP